MALVESGIDILLVNPPFSRLKGLYAVHFPIGLGYLAGALRKHFKVMIYNMEDPLSESEEQVLKSDNSSFELCYSRLFSQTDNYLRSLESDNLAVWQEAKDIFLKYKPRIIGLTCKSAEYNSALKVARIYKSCMLQGFVIFGGQHATIQSEDVLSSTDTVDFLVRQEGEKTIVELVSAILTKGSNRDFSQIDGISFRKDGVLIHTKNRNLLPELDSLAFPARDLLIKPIREKNAYGEIISSRGCPFDCAFCSAKAIWGKKVRYRCAENVIEEIKEVRDRYGTKRFNFRDDTFTLNRTMTIQLLTHIKRLKIEWECTTRVDVVDYELLKEMRKAGCFAVSYGIESGSERILKKICKNISLKQVATANSDTIRAGIISKGFVMVGFPDETDDDIRKTIEFVKRTKFLDLGLSVFTPYPGSFLFERAKQLGLLGKDIKWDETSHSSLKNFFTQCVSREKFTLLLRELINAVDKHNASLRVFLVRMAILIMNDPRIFLRRAVSKVEKILDRYLK